MTLLRFAYLTIFFFLILLVLTHKKHYPYHTNTIEGLPLVYRLKLYEDDQAEQSNYLFSNAYKERLKIEHTFLRSFSQEWQNLISQAYCSHPNGLGWYFFLYFIYIPSKTKKFMPNKVIEGKANTVSTLPVITFTLHLFISFNFQNQKRWRQNSNETLRIHTWKYALKGIIVLNFYMSY